MKKDKNKNKHKFREALSEGLAEIVLTLIFFGIGALILALFGVNWDSPSIDGDSIILLGIVAISVISAAVCALVQWFKKKTNNKSK